MRERSYEDVESNKFKFTSKVPPLSSINTNSIVCVLHLCFCVLSYVGNLGNQLGLLNTDKMHAFLDASLNIAKKSIHGSSITPIYYKTFHVFIARFL